MATTKFVKGVSGNPRGRPKNKSAPPMLRMAIAERMPEILQMLIDSALKGDISAATSLLNRCVPVLKPETLTVNLPVSESLSEQGSEVLNAIMTGKIAPDIGVQLLTALASQSKIIEFTELEARLTALEVAKK